MKQGLLLLLLITGLSAFGSPGQLVSIEHLTDSGPANIPLIRGSICPAEASLTKVFGFKRFKLVYKTTSLAGQEVDTTGLLIVPDTNGAFPMLVYQHGTLFARSELPSSNPQNQEGDLIGYCFASLGYVSVLADYLGFGDGTGVHPYLHADSEAWVARDLMRASKAALAQLNVQLNSKLFVAGYSQGGHAAMALLRLLDQDPSHEFNVTAGAPMAGPYSLDQTMAEEIGQPSPHTTAEVAYILMGLNPIYGLYKDLSEVIRPEYTSIVANMFDGTHTSKDVETQLSMSPIDLVQPDYLKSVTNDPNAPVIKALQANSVYEWTPKVPLRLYHGHADHEVPYANSELAYNYMKGQGADVELINLGEVDHGPGIVLAIGEAALWFETFP